MLRAVRFASRFGYAIEPQTKAAIQKLASQIHQVSRERVRDELTKMLIEGHARNAFLLLDDHQCKWYSHLLRRGGEPRRDPILELVEEQRLMTRVAFVQRGE